jgi:glycosyltransferase involved in cell wall biosynthesis
LPEISVCIPARQEEWLNRTVDDVLQRSKADTEVIVVLDGAWPAEPLPQHPRLQVLYLPEAVGQRAATNLAARVSTAPWLVKLDAHCSVAEGWDAALLEDAATLGPDVVQVPAQRNLHVYDWVCGQCGRREYQCALTECRACNSKDLTRDVVWQPKRGVHTRRWAFDADLRFQYWGGESKSAHVETMSCLGACWFVSRTQWEAFGGLDEKHGSWGQVGTELGCKAWLSGGRLVTNNRTWYAHFFRVGGQKFPYPISGSEQEAARVYSRDLWRGNKWPGQKYPLRWLVDKFWPVPGWTEEQRDALPDLEARRAGVDRAVSSRDDDVAGGDAHHGVAAVPLRLTKGIVYYTDNRPDERIQLAVRDLLGRTGLPIVAVSLKPLDWPEALNVVLPLERGYEAMFKQILVGLEVLKADTVFFCEHDVLYHPSHFDFDLPARDKVFYNEHVWKVSAADGRALHYRCAQTSGLCADRQLLLAHYRKRVALVEANGFTRAMGFEPGTHGRTERVDDLTSDTWMSLFPNVDIRHDANLTESRWRKGQFRNPKYTAGWTEGTGVPGWGETAGRFDDFLREVAHGAIQQAVA